MIVNGEPAGTRTQDPRIKRATQTLTTKDDRVRPIDTIPLKSCNISFLHSITIYDLDISLIVTKTATEPQKNRYP